MIIRRRPALLAGGLALVAGCDRVGGGRAAAGRRAADDADARLRRRAAADSARLLARYDSTAAGHPSLTARLRPLRAEVADHLAVFAGDGAASPSFPPAATRAPSASASPSASPPDGAPRSPAASLAALAALATAEQRLVDDRTAALLGASPDLARLLASVAAAGAGHVLLLGRLGEGA